ncbi:MAG: sodium/proline symporter PutP [Propionibacteriaceae bacterium]|jgi:sodium/proline symporter|nr:sodium/proline symporter PutP [Propionibacteriaceae bacterium]
MNNAHTAWSIAAIAVYFAMMLLLGYLAYRRTRNLDDYMLGGRRLHPAVAALSAGAADMSGWLLMGLPGALYLTGLVEAWMSIGLTIGVWCNWYFVAPRLRAYTEVAGDAITIPTFFDRRFGQGNHSLRVAAGVIILVFFTFYVSSGMTASGTFMHATFGLDAWWGILIVAGVTLVYTFFGGFLGATWTDVAQGLLMLAALVVVPIMTVVKMGGWSVVVDTLTTLDRAEGTDHFSFVVGSSAAAIISAAAWGLGYFGQPHIIVRFMALRSVQSATFGRRVGIVWMVLISIGACAAGLIGRAFFIDHPLADQETVFLALSQALFHPFVAGLVLSAVLAAIMSTLSSQLVVCSSALVEDLLLLFKKGGLTKPQGLWAGRIGVLAVAIIAAILALTAQDTILALVAFAWAGFGAAFGPIVLLSLYWRRLTRPGALAGMVAGAITVVVWGKSALSGVLYEIVPGFLVCLLVAVAVSLATAAPSATVIAEFDRAKALTQRQ